MAQPYDSSFDQREQIRDAIDIVDLVERYVPLRRQGANFVGRCPWHDDSRPSLQVNAQRQTFKCWVCNIGGDVFSFIMRIENVDFKESMQILADIAGIELVKKKSGFKRFSNPRRNPRLAGPADSSSSAPLAELDDAPSDPAYVPESISKPDLYRAMDWLSGKYRQTFLESPEAEEARRYVRERGISDASSERFRIGYAPLGYDETLKWIRFDRNRVRILETAGILAYREEYDERGRAKPRPAASSTPLLTDEERRRYYDRFRGRLIFPIRDVQDRVVAFGGRLLPNTPLKSPAKYVNSPETPIFTKSKMVYGLDVARNSIREKRCVLITEGYTDCIVTSQFGFENVVAVLGTALGAEHVRILKRFADKMILLLDGDEPGQKRAREVLRFFVEQGVNMSVLTLPDNDDPCEYLLEKGPEAFGNLLEHGPVDALDHAFQTTTAGIDLDGDVVESAKALDSLLDVVALFPEETRSSNDPARLRIIKTVQRLATRFRVSEQEIRRQIAEKRARGRAYAQRAEEREERYEQRRQEYDGADGIEAPEQDERAARIAEFRRDWIYPVASSEEETDEELRERFEPFERSLWNDRRFLPNILEREYLQVWLVKPALYPRLVAKISIESFNSPITRQLDLVARDYLELGLEPTFDRVMLRYEDDSMKSFLIELDADAEAKNFAAALEDEEKCETVLNDIFSGFERARLEREAPKRLSELRESGATDADKLKTLLEIRNMQQAKQQTRNANTLFDYESDDDSDGGYPSDGYRQN